MTLIARRHLQLNHGGVAAGREDTCFVLPEDVPITMNATMMGTIIVANATVSDLADSTNATMAAEEFCLDSLYETQVGGLFYIGIIISVISSASTNFGANVQKLALTRERRRPLLKQRPMYFIPLWVGGLILFLASQAGDAVALNFAPQSVVQPAGSVALLANMIFGWWLNNEPIGHLTPVAIVVIIGGVGMIVSFGPKVTVDWNAQEIENRWSTDIMRAYAAGAGSLTLSLVALLWYYDNKINRAFAKLRAREREAMVPVPLPSPPPSPPGISAKVAPDSLGAGSEASPAAVKPMVSPLDYLSLAEQRLVTVLYPLTASVVGGWTPLLMKQFTLLATALGRGDPVYLRPVSWAIVLGVICSGVGQLVCLFKGLRYVEAQLMVPTFASLFTICSIVGGAVFFQELQGFCVLRVGLFVLSVVVTMLGVALLYVGRIEAVGASDEGRGGNSVEHRASGAGTGDVIDASRDQRTSFPPAKAGLRKSKLVPFSGLAFPLKSAAIYPAITRTLRVHHLEDTNEVDAVQPGRPRRVRVLSREDTS